MTSEIDQNVQQGLQEGNELKKGSPLRAARSGDFILSGVWKRLPAIARSAVLLVALFIVMFPALWIVSTSIKTDQEALQESPTWIPRSFTLENYTSQWSQEVLGGSTLLSFIVNGMVVAFSVTLISMVLATLTGYSFSRFKFYGRNALLIGILNTQMFPYIAIVVPIYVMYRSLGLLNSYTGLIMGELGLVLPFSIWMVKSFCDAISRDLEDSALIDGANRLHILWSIMIPLITPGIISVAMFSFLTSWNHLLYVMILSTDESAITVPLALVRTYGSGYFYYYGSLSAGLVTVTLPVVVVFILLQRYFISGLTAGAVKG